MSTFFRCLIATCIILVSKTSPAQITLIDTCHECPPPGRIAKGGLMDLIIGNGRSLQNCTSIKRTVIRKYDRDIQALDVHYQRGDSCLETVLELGNASAIGYGGLGISGNPIETPVRPAREIFRSRGPLYPASSFISITPFIGYGGKDTTRREIGFASIYYGLELLVAPFGSLLGERVGLAAAAALLDEDGRLRIPIGGYLRWTFMGGEHVEQTHRFIPGPCRFSSPGEHPDTIPSGYTEVPSEGRPVDSTVFYIHEQEISRSSFRPYVYLEGGWILNGTFSGAGKNPSENPDEYGQYYAGGGVGLPILSWMTASLGYRYLRLNLRTPCAVCPGDVFVQNTNTIHSAVLKVGANLPF
jgi:hypothetical protein